MADDGTNQGLAIVLQALLQQQRDTDAKIDRLDTKIDARLAQVMPRVEIEQRFGDLATAFETFKRDSFASLKTDVDDMKSTRLPRWVWTVLIWLGPVLAVVLSHVLSVYWPR